MSTRTAIFKEMKDGIYQGVYVHTDGYINYTGKLLNQYYKGNNKIDYIIKQKYPIHSLGQSEKLINFNTQRTLAMEKNVDGFMKYTTTGYDRPTIKHMYFKAESIEEIRNMQYLTYDEHDKLQGFMVEDEFIPYRGSDNNGYLYLQDQSGLWYVSYMKNDKGDMSVFKPLNQVLKRLS